MDKMLRFWQFCDFEEVAKVHHSQQPLRLVMVALYNIGQTIIFSCCGLFMVALCNRETIYIFMLWFVLSFFSSSNLSRRRLDVCHTSTHGVALVRI